MEVMIEKQRQNKRKFCPLIKGQCLKEECEWWESGCAIKHLVPVL